MLAPHPFPARMAPELALNAVGTVAKGPVLDPMCGSGTVLRAAMEAGRDAIGIDMDPLAVLMSRVWTSGPDEDLIGAAETAISRSTQRALSPHLPWIDNNPETAAYINFWFGPGQQHDLRRLSSVLVPAEGPTGDALRLALSRTIVTKDHGASLGRDVSHSRPHKTRTENDFDVIKGFMKGAAKISRVLSENRTSAKAVVSLGDARSIPQVESASVETIVTSPPYLNAIDYIRGHRLALVWLGYSVDELRCIRSGSIGAERRLRNNDRSIVAGEITKEHGDWHWPNRLRGILLRYVSDLVQVMSESQRVLSDPGKLVMVIGNSTTGGVFVDNASLATSAAKYCGLELLERIERELPAARRYLPPPRLHDHHDLAKRMRTEVVLTFRKAC